MPTRPPRICDCGKVVPSGATCSCQMRTARERKARFDRTREGARSRGYDSEWQREAKAFLALPGNERCECGAPAVLVRHLKSIRQRPDLRMDQSNWRPGCQRCNAKDAAREREQAGGRGNRRDRDT